MPRWAASIWTSVFGNAVIKMTGTSQCPRRKRRIASSPVAPGMRKSDARGVGGYRGYHPGYYRASPHVTAHVAVGVGFHGGGRGRR
jgi:hypothetical protein